MQQFSMVRFFLATMKVFEYVCARKSDKEKIALRCVVCGLSVELDEMTLMGWIPLFYEGEDEHGPLCPSCAERLIDGENSGVYVLREEFRAKVVYRYEEDKDSGDEDCPKEIALGFILN
jgi:hypothetical protein